MMPARIPRPLLIPLIVLGTFAGGCNRSSGPDLTAEVQRLTSELEATRLQLATAEKGVATKREDAVITTAIDPAKKETAPATAAPAEKDAQTSALRKEIEELRKSDAFVFAEASAAFRIGTNDALLRYQQFLKDFPNSPLAADADRAIAELNTTVRREARARMSIIDPRRPEREALQRFNEGNATIEELSPLLKNRSPAEVVKLLGPPNQTYRDGKEYGYDDRILDPNTGAKATLVIGFDSEIATTLRVGYLGKPVKL